MNNPPDYHLYPLWACLARFNGRELHDARRLYGWACLLDDWHEIQRLIDASPDPTFRDSLSSGQRESYNLLRCWWDAAYCKESLINSTISWLAGQRETETTRSVIDGDELLRISGEVGTDASLYHSHLFRLFLLELHPYAWEAPRVESVPSLAQEWDMFGHPDPALLFSILSRRLLSAEMAECRYGAAVKATIQKLSHAELVGPSRLPVSIQQQYPVVLQADYATQPSTITSGFCHKPYYLWDSLERKTVVTGRLHGMPEYLCISHTWGRWRTNTDVDLSCHDIPWPVPENSIYQVADLPQQFADLGDRIGIRYIWFDLFCIPQKGQVQLKEQEIGRQASIFKGSRSCIAWIHDVHTWTALQAALRWIILKSMEVTSTCYSQEITQSVLVDAANHSQAAPELLPHAETLDINPSSWFTSLWTLQECALCPDIELYSRNWVRLEDGHGNALPLRSLSVFIQKAIPLCWYTKPITKPLPGLFSWVSRFFEVGTATISFGNPTAWDEVFGAHPYQQEHLRKMGMPRGAYLLVGWQMMTRLQAVLISNSPTAVLSTSNVRECRSDRRADAIMSAIGVTDWYHSAAARSSPRVFQSYPLEFLREAAQKIGGAFYNACVTVKRPGPDWVAVDLEGSMLPVSKTQGLFAGRLNSSPEIQLAKIDHSSVETWVINSRGSVKISSAGILLSSSDLGGPKIPGLIRCDANPYVDAGKVDMEQEPQTDMLAKLKSLRFHDRCIYAVALYQELNVFLFGVLLEDMGVISGQRTLTKIGEFVAFGVHLPRPVPVDWLVL